MAKDKIEVKVVVLNQERTVTEIVQDRPELFIGTATGNVFLIRDEHVVYVKIVMCLGAFHHIGPSSHTSKFKGDRMKYTGPIDDEMMANILMYGG